MAPKLNSTIQQIFYNFSCNYFATGIMTLHKKYYLLIISFLVATQLLSAQYEFNVPLLNAYKEISLLKVDRGEQILKEYVAKGTRNGCSLLIANYADFTRIMISEDEYLYEKLLPNKDKRLDELKNFDKNSPYFKFIKAEIIFHWAMIRLKNGKELDAALEFLKAYKLLEENKKDHPDFIYNYKTLGLYHVLLGNVPVKYKSLLKMFGFISDSKMGINELKKAAETHHILQQQALFLACILDHFVLHSTEHIAVLEQITRKEPNNVLAAYLYASILAKSNKGSDALSVLQGMQPAEGTLNFTYLHYLKGTLLLQKGDYEAANQEFNTFLKDFKGQNYRKDCYYKLSLIADLKEDSLLAKDYRDSVVRYGISEFESDQHALNKCAKYKYTDLRILKAMLKFDGGYLLEAKEILDGIPANQLKTNEEQVELVYRKGRVCQELKLEKDAIGFFRLAINMQKDEKYYYAPNACLQLGYIYSKSEASKATAYFNKVLEYSGFEYENSIDAKAKAGLTKLNTK